MLHRLCRCWLPSGHVSVVSTTLPLWVSEESHSKSTPGSGGFEWKVESQGTDKGRKQGHGSLAGTIISPTSSSPRGVCSGSGALRVYVDAAELCRDSLLEFFFDSFWFGVFCSPPILSTDEDLTACSEMSFFPKSSHRIPGQVGSPDVNTPCRKGWGEFCWRGQNCVCRGRGLLPVMLSAAYISLDQRDAAFLFSPLPSAGLRSEIAREQLQIA